MLDGGLRAWRRARFKLTDKPMRPTPSSFKARLNQTVLATMRQVHDSLEEDHDSIILDVRSSEEYDGTLVRAAHAGHIPTSRNIDWKQTLTRQGTLKPRKELEKLYRNNGVRKDNEIVTYCQAAYRAAHTYLVLKLLDYPNVRNYLGSWAEWGNSPGVPAEGPNRRT